MKAFDYEPQFQKSLLDNGVRVVTEHHPNTRTTSTGIYVDLGTRDEPEDIVGAAHFVEHIVFKGTETRTAYEIAKTLEAVGGELNAFTSRENTCFHAATLREHLPLALDVLCDVVSQAKFSDDDFEKERNVILHEIDMSADSYEEHIFDLYFEEAYRGHNLGRSILGTPDSLAGFTREKLMDFYTSRYHGKDLVVCVAGDVDHDKVVEEVNNRLQLGRKEFQRPERSLPEVQSFRRVVRKQAEQVHLLMGLPSSAFKSEHRFEAYIVNAFLGGGVTSQLYQKVREHRGLAYSVYSYLHAYTDSGLLMTYAGTAEESLPKVYELIYQEMAELKDKGIGQKDLDLYKNQVLGQILLGSDDIENRMNSIGVNEMVFGNYRPVDTVLAEIERVSVESIKKYLDEHFDFSKMGFLVLGDVDEDKTLKLAESLK